jgi:Protein of unknown function (DUF669)
VPKLKVDFSGVDPDIRRGGGAAHIPEGDYLAKIVDSEMRESEKSGSRYISWKLAIANGEFKGKTIYHITSLKPEALWNFRNLIHAATGKNVAGKALNVDTTALESKVIAVTVEDDEYEGKVRSRIVDTRPKDELELEAETEEEEEEEEEEAEEELEDVDLEEL